MFQSPPTSLNIGHLLHLVWPPWNFQRRFSGQDAGSDGSAWCGPDASRSWRASFDCTCQKNEPVAVVTGLVSSETVEVLSGFYMVFYMVFYLVFIWFIYGLYMVYIYIKVSINGSTLNRSLDGWFHGQSEKITWMMTGGTRIDGFIVLTTL